jgi:hypothetical protein
MKNIRIYYGRRYVKAGPEKAKIALKSGSFEVLPSGNLKKK